MSIFLKSLRKISFHENLKRMTGTLREDLHKFMIMSRSVLLRMKNVSDKICKENQNSHFMFSSFFFFRKSYRLWDNVEKYDTARQITDGNMAHAHWLLDT